MDQPNGLWKLLSFEDFLEFWRDFPKLAVRFVSNNIKRAIRALTDIADSLSTIG